MTADLLQRVSFSADDKPAPAVTDAGELREFPKGFNSKRVHLHTHHHHHLVFFYLIIKGKLSQSSAVISKAPQGMKVLAFVFFP